jgi:hypothetical protein
VGLGRSVTSVVRAVGCGLDAEQGFLVGQRSEAPLHTEYLSGHRALMVDSQIRAKLRLLLQPQQGLECELRRVRDAGIGSLPRRRNDEADEGQQRKDVLHGSLVELESDEVGGDFREPRIGGGITRRDGKNEILLLLGNCNLFSLGKRATVELEERGVPPISPPSGTQISR